MSISPPEDTSDEAAPRWWRTLEEQASPSAARARHADEFAEELPLDGAGLDDGTRRTFLKVMGLSATATLAACQRAPEQKILPYTTKPDEVTPGLALWYASACGGCAARCGLLVKTRDGRPIKIEGNPTHPVSGGAVCAVGQASVLGLYDADRARGPQVGGKPATWKEVDAAVAAGLARAAKDGRAVRIVVPWGTGPSEEKTLGQLIDAHAGARVVRFDPMGQRDAIAAAHGALYGARAIPDYRLEVAHTVVGFEADFLGTFLAPAILTRQWSAARDPARQPMLEHFQVESNLTLTGGAADERVALPPSALVPALARVVTALAAHGEGRAVALAKSVLAELGPRAVVPAEATGGLDRAAQALQAAGAYGLVICGSDDPAAQLLAALANALLGNAETTAPLDRTQASPRDELTVGQLCAELEAGGVGALLFLGTNPAHVDKRVAAALPRVPFSLSTSDRFDETAALTTVFAPRGHFLEVWTDHRPRAGVETMGQPCVAPLFDTRSEMSSLLAWSGAPADAYAFLKQRWMVDVLADGSTAAWEAAVRDGVSTRAMPREALPLVATPDAVLGLLRATRAGPPAGGEALELVLHASVGLFDGSGSTANNGWLQELPDPISKVSWGNQAALAPARASALGIADGDVVELTTSAGTIRLPARVQPGLPANVVAVAVGHGRARAGRNAVGHGVDAWPLADVVGARLRRAGIAVSLKKTGENRPLALAQTHASQEGRELVRQESLAALGHRPPAEHGEGKHATRPGGAPKRPHGLGLWPEHAYQGHRWGLVVDLNKCTGCSACVVSCSAENNIPIVGEVEVQRRRELHWMRIDRYYGGTPDAPEVLHQPMMCQHCENAPCETVCPVLATVHSSEGLNQQIYNRCVGTRYCANNCPTKVRRFNWFDYERGGDLGRMVLNPDVVVRSRGVMEKCTLCVHRIEEARALGRREGRTLADGDIVTACQQSCPAQAITFGDGNDPKSALSKLRKDGRAYTILEEINVKPQVTYMTRVKNGSEGGGHHG